MQFIHWTCVHYRWRCVSLEEKTHLGRHLVVKLSIVCISQLYWMFATNFYIRNTEESMVVIKCFRLEIALGPSLMLYMVLVKRRKIMRAYSSIPSVEFHQNNERGDLTCSVCFEDFIDGETVKRVKECEHMFHRECIYTWIHVQCICPMCRMIL